MPTMSIFFRLLDSPIDSKGADLLQQIALQNQGENPEKAFSISPVYFGSIAGSPFAYWMKEKVRELFINLPCFEQAVGHAVNGHTTGDDFHFVRAFWEIDSRLLAISRNETKDKKRWVSFTKGGLYSPYYSDIHLVIDWADDGYSLRKNPNTFLRNETFQFKPGITWPLRTSRFSPAPLPKGTIFSVRGYGAFSNKLDLKLVLGISNSSVFDHCFKIMLGRFGFPEFVVGVLLKLPWPAAIADDTSKKIITFVDQAIELRKFTYLNDETTRIFQLPYILSQANHINELLFVTKDIEKNRNEKQQKFLEIQSELDKVVAGLYQAPELIEPNSGLNFISEDEDVKDDYEDFSPGIEMEDAAQLVSDLFMWAFGAYIGRWDARFAINPDLLPELTGPFDPLPRCSPGMLLSPDGLPAIQGNIVSEAWLRARPNVLTLPATMDGPQTIPDQDYPLPIAWDGILVDDPDHPRDIVSAARRVLRLIWKEQADAIEKEACQILDVTDLRAYFRDPHLFFNYHIKRYSKSRRKAPIYWLLQSAKRNYAVWIYYPRLNPDLLFRAGREYVDSKLTLETSRLKELRSNLTGLTGSNLKTRERQVSRQVDLIEELKAFGKELDRVALLELKPDLNDGVLLNIAPLYNLVPWKEAEKAWKELAGGKYEWSSIGQQLRQKGWVKK